ncbi:hypothetical protein [Dishui Lake large algae virus 1]|nr:hypothetical protein [Dishui Lake large algae virus 1]
MYENSLSIANIQKVLKGGMAEKYYTGSGIKEIKEKMSTIIQKKVIEKYLNNYVEALGLDDLMINTKQMATKLTDEGFKVTDMNTLAKIKINKKNPIEIKNTGLTPDDIKDVQQYGIKPDNIPKIINRLQIDHTKLRDIEIENIPTKGITPADLNTITNVINDKYKIMPKDVSSVVQVKAGEAAPGAAAPGTVPGTAPGAAPGTVPEAAPGAAPETAPGAAPEAVPGAAPGAAAPEAKPGAAAPEAKPGAKPEGGETVGTVSHEEVKIEKIDDKEDTMFNIIKKGLKLAWKIRSGLILIVMFIIGFILSLILLITIHVMRNKVDKISSENRYNRDLPEYNVVRSGKLVKVYFIIIGLAALSIALVLFNFSIIYIKWDDYKEMKDEQGTPKINEIKNWNTIYLAIFIINVILLTVANINYKSMQKSLKNIKNRIDNFERYVFSNFYINQEFMNTLYNNNKVPDDVDAIKNAAIINAITDGNGSINPSLIDVNGKLMYTDLSKAIYTLCMYKFLNEDLENNELTGNNYKTDALSLFDIRLLSIPNNRVFRVADYMRAEIPIGLNTNRDLENIIHDIEIKTQTSIPDRIAIKVSDMLDNTRSMALDIGAFNAWPPVRDMFHYTVIVYVAVILALVIVAFITYLMNKKTV